MHFSVAYEYMDAHERSMENENCIGYLFVEETEFYLLSYYSF